MRNILSHVVMGIYFTCMIYRACAQPIRDVVTKQRRLLLAWRKPRISPDTFRHLVLDLRHRLDHKATTYFFHKFFYLIHIIWPPFEHIIYCPGLWYCLIDEQYYWDDSRFHNDISYEYISPSKMRCCRPSKHDSLIRHNIPMIHNDWKALIIITLVNVERKQTQNGEKNMTGE